MEEKLGERRPHFFHRLVAHPVDIASLATFRLLFGLLMCTAMVRFLAKGWVREFYVAPQFHFTYPGFEWVQPWPDFWMHAHFVLLALLALGIGLGFFYRACTVLFFLGFTYVELLDQTTYLNHYYLVSLLSGLLIFLPAHRAWSIDAWLKPKLRTSSVPAWCLNLLRFQVAVVYIFAGLAKFNVDWLFRAEPLRIWLAARSDLPIIGPWLSQLWVAYAASWFGAFFDTFIVFFLLARRTRRAAYFVLIAFHVATWVLFHIGMFPWIMIVAATILFPSDWPHFWLRRLVQFTSISLTPRFTQSLQFEPRVLPHPRPGSARRFTKQRSPGSLANVLPLPEEEGRGEGEHRIRRTNPSLSERSIPCHAGWRLILPLTLYAAIQLVLPLRPYFQSQPSAWTCSGFNCAWQVMIVEKTGYSEFFSVNPETGQKQRIPIDRFLTPRQKTMMDQDPFLIRDMARRLPAVLQNSRSLEIHVDAFATLNGRPNQRIINPDVDLAGPLPNNWITPLASRESWSGLLSRR